MIRCIALFVFCGLVMGLQSQPAWAEPPGDPVKGKAMYERLCITCHGARGKGDGPAGPMMTPHPADFTSPKIKGKPDGELVQTIQNGKSGTSMAGFKGQLSEQQIHDVLAFIRSLGR